MKAITLWQPWATWIAKGWKTIETRKHNRFASLAGQRIAIHAGLKFDAQAFDLASPWWIDEDEQLMAETCEYPHGAVVATVLCTEARRLTDKDSRKALIAARRLFGLILADRVPIFLPRPAKGKQGIWEWDEHAMDYLTPSTIFKTGA